MTAPRRGDQRDLAATPRKPPPCQPASERSDASAVIGWERVDVDFYEVRRGAAVVGFVDVVGAVFVAYAGPRPDTAVEVAQTLVFETAVDILHARA